MKITSGGKDSFYTALDKSGGRNNSRPMQSTDGGKAKQQNPHKRKLYSQFLSSQTKDSKGASSNNKSFHTATNVGKF